jgi:hypothetical protein
MKAFSKEMLYVRASRLLLAPLFAIGGIGFPAALHAQDEDPEVNILELVLPESEWKYNDSGTDLGTGWTAPDFNDASWKTGMSPLGYGESRGLNTEIEFGGDTSNRHITYYFRKEFEVPSLSLFTTMILRVQRDDGVVVYVNGSPIVKDNFPLTETEIKFDTEAEVPLSGSKERAWLEISSTTSSLRVGRNVISAEVHQESPTSSDMRFEAELKVSDAIPAFGAVRVGIQTKFSEARRGVLEFTRDVLESPPHIEMEWKAKESGRLFVTTTDFDFVEFTEILDENGEIDYQLGIYDATMSSFESEQIDTRNYNNVQVKMDVRTNDPAGNNGFETSDNLKGEIKVSLDGAKFETIPWFELKGGGTTPIEWTEAINGDTVKYAMVPTDAATPEADWKDSLEYNQGDWLSGKEGVGYEASTGFEDLIGVDVKGAMRSLNGSCYVRIPFNVTGIDEFTELQLRMKYDDGFVAYLNGKEVAARNKPDPLEWNSLSTERHSDTKAVIYEDFDLKSGAGVGSVSDLVNEGDNLLTIHGLNEPSGSSDFLIYPLLRLGKPGEGVTDSLDAYNFGTENRLTTIETTLGDIPNSAASMIIRLKGKVNDKNGEMIYMDNIRTIGDPIASDSFQAYMQLETGWALDDPRMDAYADPDGDSIKNLMEYAYGTPPHIGSLTTMVKGEEVPVMPEFIVNRGGFITMTYRQIAAPLIDPRARDANEGYHVQDIVYRPQLSLGETDLDGVWDWFDGSSGGVPIFEQREPFKENEDGTVQVKLKGVFALPDRKEVYVRQLVRIVGFESIEK